MKIAVTGGAGFIGHHLVKRLLERGDEVYVIDDLSTGDVDRLLDSKGYPLNGLTIYKADIVSDQLPALEMDAVVHLAAPVSVPESLEDPEKYYRGIVHGSARVFQWAKKWGVKHVVAASTAAVYGESQQLPLAEDGPLDPMSPYAEYKLQMEDLLSCLNSKEINCVALRFFNVFGEGQRDSGGYVSAVPIFLKQYNHFEPITVTGDGQQTRDFVYVGDVCNAIMKALEQDWQADMPVYNVGSGQETKIIEIAEALGGEIKFIAPRNEPKRSLSDITNISAELDWRPDTDVQQWLIKQR
jgi:UDP-glucose 4-epimerase